MTTPVTVVKHDPQTMGPMNSRNRPQSKAVAAGTAAGLRHLDRVYVAKVNALIAEDRPDVAQELADDHARLTDQEPAGCGRRARRSVRALVGLSR